VKETNAKRLQQEFAEIKFMLGGVEDFSLRIMALVNELRVLGDDISDKRGGEKDASLGA
jgi:hypothetical protein